MKIKGLFLGLLTCAALTTACTNEELVDDSNIKIETGQLQDVPAYVSLSIATSGNSSRAVSSRTADDSGIHNDGTVGEGNITDILIVIKGVTAEGADAINSGIAEVIPVDDLTAGSATGVYTVNKKFRVLAGAQKILVIANPTAAIKAMVPGANEYAKIATLYNELLDMKFADLAAVTTDNQFMMANNQEVTITAKSTNSETSPAEASVSIERVASKITFRSTTIAGEGEANLYPIEFNVALKGYTVETKDGASYAISTDKAGTPVAVKINALTEGDKATSDQGEYVKKITYALAEKLHQVYAYNASTNAIGTELLTAREYNDETSIPQPGIYYADAAAAGAAYTWEAPYAVFKDYTRKVSDWKVSLTQYALVNLHKEVNAIRHTADPLGQTVVPFGFIGTNNYIADANFKVKNQAAVDFNFANYDQWSTDDADRWDAAAQSWFTNTLKQIADESSKGAATTQYFAALPTTGVMPDDNTPATTNPGLLMQYCFENTTVSSMQKHGLTTGIAFKGILEPAAGQAFAAKMYQYDGKVFEDLTEIIKAYGPGSKAIAALTAGSDDNAIKAAGIRIYQDQECYYYTSQVKHYDNGDNNVAGVMEFAIVRNNIYSLAVNNIKGIGDAAIDPNPGTDNESAVGYIQVQATILPWIVRYNNIEF